MLWLLQLCYCCNSSHNNITYIHIHILVYLDAFATRNLCRFELPAAVQILSHHITSHHIAPVAVAVAVPLSFVLFCLWSALEGANTEVPSRPACLADVRATVPLPGYLSHVQETDRQVQEGKKERISPLFPACTQVFAMVVATVMNREHSDTAIYIPRSVITTQPQRQYAIPNSCYCQIRDPTTTTTSQVATLHNLWPVHVAVTHE